MTKFNLRAMTAIGSVALITLSGCSMSSDPISSVSVATDELVARPDPRLFLTPSVLAGLKQRAASGDGAWTALQRQCEQLTTGTMNPPSGPAYPNSPDVGSGYQGEEYVSPIFALGLCYWTSSDASAQARYGAAGSRLLEAMSTPVGSGGQPPSTDSGYGIRNYGVGMAVGYDWLYPALSSATRARVIASLDAWIDWYDQSGFIRNHPIGNYFVGYLLAKTTAALATEGDDPKATTYWADVETRMWGQLVKPFFAQSMSGGGWPEGWQYGPRAVRGLAEFLWAVNTAKGLTWSADIPQVSDQAAYIRHFAWPSLNHMDDQGTVRGGTSMQPSATLATSLATILGYMGNPAAGPARAHAADVLATSADDRSPWQKFLYWDPALATSADASRPASYLATGPGHVAVRSSWSKDAVWGALASGAYIDAPDSGEQMFNQGSLSVVRGDDPILVNATGWIPQIGGTSGEDFVYDDTWGSKGRKLYNTFFVADPNNRYSPGQSGTGPSATSPRVERFEDRGVYVRARAASLHTMYAPTGSTQPVTQFTRDLVFVRPDIFVLLDRTTVSSAGSDQWLGIHTAAPPVVAAATDSTQRRFDIQKGGATIGSLRTLLPKAAGTNVVSLPGGVARLEVRPSSAGATQDWLNVLTAGDAVPGQVRMTTADGNVLAGGVVGVHLQGARNRVVLFAGAHAANVDATSARYVVRQTADADHVLVDLSPSTSGYAVTATTAAGALTIDVTPGGPFQVTPAGTMSFAVSMQGSVAPIGVGPAAPPPVALDAGSPVVPLPAPPPPPVVPPTTPLPAPSATVSLTQGLAGYSGAQDLSITSMNLSDSHGTGVTFRDNDQLYTYVTDYAAKAILRFELGGIPTSAVVTGAHLDLTVESWTNGVSLVGDYLTASWDYASVGWTARSPGVSWSTPGIGAGDWAGSPFSLGLIASTGYQRKRVDLDPSRVQAWVRNSAQNDGVLVWNATTGAIVRILSSETADPVNRPALTVSYQMP